MGEGKVSQSTIYWTWGQRKLCFKQRTYPGKRTHGSIPLGMWSKAWVCGPLLAGIVGLSWRVWMWPVSVVCCQVKI